MVQIGHGGRVFAHTRCGPTPSRPRPDTAGARRTRVADPGTASGRSSPPGAASVASSRRRGGTALPRSAWLGFQSRAFPDAGPPGRTRSGYECSARSGDVRGQDRGRGLRFGAPDARSRRFVARPWKPETSRAAGSVRSGCGCRATSDRPGRAAGGRLARALANPLQCPRRFVWPEPGHRGGAVRQHRCPFQHRDSSA